MIVEIPTHADLEWYSLAVSLDGRGYQFSIRWQTREERWTLSVKDSDGELIVAGVPLVVDWPLLSLFTDSRLPPGKLMLIDVTGEGREAAHDDLGDRCKLVYVEAS
jgi:hypothetical protein